MSNILKTIAFGLVVFVLALLAWIVKTNFIDKPTLVTVVGEGRVMVEPKLVKFTMAVMNTAQTPTQALVDNNNRMASLVSLLKQVGVDQKDMVLSYVRVIPVTETNYQAVNSADITLRDLSLFDELVLKLYNQGAQSISNIVFTVDNSRDLEKQAVAKAVTDAQARAQEMAKASNKELGRVVSMATSETGEAGALSGQAANNQGGTSASSPSQIEIVRQASLVMELR